MSSYLEPTQYLKAKSLCSNIRQNQFKINIEKYFGMIYLDLRVATDSNIL